MITLSNGKRLANVEEFASEIGTSTKYVRHQYNSGVLPYRLQGRKVQFLLPDDLDEYLDRIRENAAR